MPGIALLVFREVLEAALIVSIVAAGAAAAPSATPCAPACWATARCWGRRCAS